MDRRVMAGPLKAGLLLCGCTLSPAEPVGVRYAEGLLHGFLALRGADGTLLANGDLIQTARGDRVTAQLTFPFKDGSVHEETAAAAKQLEAHGGRVTSQLTFHFKDGSVSDETAIFTESGKLRLVTDRVTQKGPTFPRPLDMTIDAQTGRVTVRYKDDDGKEKVEDKQLELPPDVANGMMIVLLKNVTPKTLPSSVSYVAATPKPQLVKLIVTAAGLEPFSIVGSGRQAEHYVIKAEIGGLAGVVAPILGKEPPLNHIWILQGPAPAFVKSEGPLYMGGTAARRCREQSVAELVAELCASS